MQHNFTDFARASFPSMEWTPFHTAYYRLLDRFATGHIRRLMITVPPQHGKSTASSILLPSYILGLDPDRRIAIASYSASLAQKFNKRAQRLIEQPFYGELFPDTAIKCTGGRSSYVRTAEQVEIIGRTGELTAVGREGPLTGNAVDTFIIDDLYKDAMEANSPTVRENCWEWYTSVVRTREHNLSQELIVFTRWHKDDLIGSISAREKVVELSEWSQLDEPDPSCWYRLNLEAVKESAPTEMDPRQHGQTLWPSRHSAELLGEKRRLDPLRFECMYQGHPTDAAGLLYGADFGTYDTIPADTIRRHGNYTDTADTGDDYLCSICYSVGTDELIYVEEVLYSREKMEVTEPLTAEMLVRNGTLDAIVESNNGGRGFARNVQRLAPKVNVAWFHQSANKEARILSNSSSVVRNIRFPQDWRERWPDFAAHVTTYNRRFRSNRWHDAADVLTGMIETECTKVLKKRIYNSSFRISNYARPKETE